VRESLNKNILIVRTDRIGDVVLTLPLVDVLKSHFPASTVSFLARSYTSNILDGYEGVDEVLLYDQNGEPKPFTAMLSELRKAKFDVAVVAFPRFRIAALLWLAGVRLRIGSGYRWYSFLFNGRVYEHRKTAEKHELDYNLSLLKMLGCQLPHDAKPTIRLTDQDRLAATTERRRLRISGQSKTVILHPGSGGSARDWGTANFAKLAVDLAERGWNVVLTGARGEEKLVNKVVAEANGKVKTSVGRFTLRELAAFIQSMDLFISNSTGPLHIAAAVGTPVIGFYPPILACSPDRWGPVTERKILFVPDRVKCELCKGGPCKGDVCMDQITVSQVREAAQSLVLKHTEKHRRKSPVHA
jgi:heptosyltransferase-3